MLVSRLENDPLQTKICSGKVHFNFIVSFLFILSPFLAASNPVHLPAHPSSPSTVSGSVHTSAKLKSPLFLVRGLKTSSILSSPDSCILLFSAALCWSTFCHSSSRWPHLCPEYPWHPKLPFAGFAFLLLQPCWTLFSVLARQAFLWKYYSLLYLFGLWGTVCLTCVY